MGVDHSLQPNTVGASDAGFPSALVLPGLPAEMHLQTQERTILSYFMKPFSNQIARAFREG